jgi:hypothetical protein
MITYVILSHPRDLTIKGGKCEENFKIFPSETSVTLIESNAQTTLTFHRSEIITTKNEEKEDCFWPSFLDGFYG